MAEASLNDSSLSILMVGKTGYGKSSTGNSIIGLESKFKSKKSFTSVTKICQREVARVQGRKVVVVDSSGLANTDMKNHECSEKLKTEVATILAKQPEGFNAILIVINLLVRLTKEDIHVCETLDAVFGKDFTNHYGILLVTHADMYNPEENNGMTIEEHLKKEGGLFQQMLEKCNNRMVCFDNKSKDRDIRNKQLTALLSMEDEMKLTSSGYVSQTFENAKKRREDFLLKETTPFIKQETEDELNLIVQDFASIPQDCMDIRQFEDIILKLQNIKRDLIEQDKGTNTLTDVISEVSNFESTVKSIITTSQEKGDNRTTTDVAELTSKFVPELWRDFGMSGSVRARLRTYFTSSVFPIPAGSAVPIPLKSKIYSELSRVLQKMKKKN